MPNVAVVDMAGLKVGDIALSEAIFGIEPNTSAMHLAVVQYQANQRGPRFQAAAKSRGGKRAPATPVRAPPVLPSGGTAVSYLPPSLGTTGFRSIRRFADWR